MRLSCLACAAAWIVIAGCGGSVTTTSETEDGKGGAAGHAGAGGSSGAAGSAGKGGSAGTAGTGGVPTDAGAWCYGPESCAASEWCDIEPAPPGMCSSGGKAGTCRTRPKANECPDYNHCPNACGCNGVWYCSDCEAHADGVSVTADNTWCMDAGSAQYSADAWFGGLDHVFVRKADFDRNTCLVLHLAAPYEAGPELSTPQGWGLSAAFISNSAADCSGETGPGGALAAKTVTGAVQFGLGDGGYLPCTVDVHATVEFESPPPWVNAIELMDADGIPVAGGCM